MEFTDHDLIISAASNLTLSSKNRIILRKANNKGFDLSNSENNKEYLTLEQGIKAELITCIDKTFSVREELSKSLISGQKINLSLLILPTKILSWPSGESRKMDVSETQKGISPVKSPVEDRESIRRMDELARETYRIRIGDILTAIPMMRSQDFGLPSDVSIFVFLPPAFMGILLKRAVSRRAPYLIFPVSPLAISFARSAQHFDFEILELIRLEEFKKNKFSSQSKESPHIMCRQSMIDQIWTQGVNLFSKLGMNFNFIPHSYQPDAALAFFFENPDLAIVRLKSPEFRKTNYVTEGNSSVNNALDTGCIFDVLKFRLKRIATEKSLLPEEIKIIEVCNDFRFYGYNSTRMKLFERSLNELVIVMKKLDLL